MAGNPRILHLADTHVGKRQYGLEERRKDFSSAFEEAIEIAIKEEVEAVVHAGDLFDNRYPSAQDLSEVFNTLRLLREADIPFYGVVGNHEGKRGKDWLDLFEGLDLAVHLHSEPARLRDFYLYGMDYSGRSAERVNESVPAPGQGERKVLVAHQLIALEGIPGSRELDFDGGDLSTYDSVLLGDYHEYLVWRKEGTLITYPGSTERFAAGERRDRGVNLIELKSGKIERFKLSTRPFLYLGQPSEPLKGGEGMREARAYQDRMRGKVVCIYLKDPREAREIVDFCENKGALTVRIFRVGDRSTEEDGEGDQGRPMESQAEEQGPQPLRSEEDVDLYLEDKFEEGDFESPQLIESLDGIIRDVGPQGPADSQVDREVIEFLESHLEGEGAEDR